MTTKVTLSCKRWRAALKLKLTTKTLRRYACVCVGIVSALSLLDLFSFSQPVVSEVKSKKVKKEGKEKKVKTPKTGKSSSRVSDVAQKYGAIVPSTWIEVYSESDKRWLGM